MDVLVVPIQTHRANLSTMVDKQELSILDIMSLEQQGNNLSIVDTLDLSMVDTVSPNGTFHASWIPASQMSWIDTVITLWMTGFICLVGIIGKQINSQVSGYYFPP